jgi:hypothetical protein
MQGDVGNFGRFFQVMDHLEVAAALLEAEEPAKSRMAVILLDGLADALLFRRVESLLRFSEQGWYYREQMPVYNARTRKRLRVDFDTRLRVAAEATYLDAWTSSTESDAFLDPLDVTILRIAHTYRNNAYHRDHHNSVTIGIFGRLMLRSVATLAARALKTGWMTTPRPSDLERFRRLGVDISGGGFLDSGDLAAVAGDQLCERLPFNQKDVLAELADDLDNRCEGIQGTLEFLDDDGRVSSDEAIAMAEFYDRFSADDELVALSYALDPRSKSTEDEKRATFGKYRKRQAELSDANPPSISSATVGKAQAAAQRIRRASRSFPHHLNEYYVADRDLSRLEAYAEEAASALDTAIQQAVDEARGK